MDNTASGAFIIGVSETGMDVCAASARVSTTRGTALSIYEKSQTAENNASLIDKVLRSGHKSVIEHIVFSIAFNNVSVLVEQFMIEFRLASFTVQSRRYVDFGSVGHYTDSAMTPAVRERYERLIGDLFDRYNRLTALGISKEDARFVLPYCFHSNFYVTCNARELLNIITAMVCGHGSHQPEIRAIGISLAEQFDRFLPGVAQREIDSHKRGEFSLSADEIDLTPSETVSARPTLMRCDCPSKEVLSWASRYNGGAVGGERQLDGILHGERSRELELISCTYLISGLSLAAVTHLARHRVQTLFVPDVIRAAADGRHILPPNIAANPEAVEIYESAFVETLEASRELLDAGMPVYDLAYLALAGKVLDVVSCMNGRELMHFFRLRTCSRAQWEIRAAAVEMLRQAREKSPEIFGGFGPSCFVDGFCPEGRMSCGRAAEMKEIFSGKLPEV